MLHHTVVPMAPYVYTTHNVLPMNSGIMPIFHDPFNSSLPKIEDSADAHFIKFQTPGRKKEDLHIEVVGRRTLIVTAGEIQQTQGESLISEQGQLSTKTYSLYQRAVLPMDGDWSQAQLSYEDGILAVQVPKRKNGSLDSEGLGEKVKELEGQLKEKLSRVEALRAELQEEQRRSMEVERALHEEVARSVASEKRQLTIE